jgi:hypothetical protein
LNQILILLLVIFLAWFGADRLRPINAGEERSLKALLEYASQQQSIPIEERTEKLLTKFQIKNLSELPAYEWRRAMVCVSKNLD